MNSNTDIDSTDKPGGFRVDFIDLTGAVLANPVTLQRVTVIGYVSFSMLACEDHADTGRPGPSFLPTRNLGAWGRYEL